mmetsp:Transcript_22914/g.35244  ORF Transcript_22914/g.35244 Transcript_22914/m.35244 type:complete len:468 (+) Transcript_22914:176-1579(+)
MSVDVYGVYALPEVWKTKIGEAAEDQYSYEIECSGIAMQDGKVVPRELTEEEKAEADANKGGQKGKPGKDPKKKEEEPSPEELERLEKERQEREEREKKLAEEWESLDPETKHIRHNEDIFKEPCIKMQNLLIIEQVEKLQANLAEIAEEDTAAKEPIQAEIDKLITQTNIGTSFCLKEGYELIELEEQTKHEKGCWLRFMKLPPSSNEAEAAGGKKDKKGKGAVSDEMKPTFARGWVSFADLQNPGSTECTQRVFLETCAPIVKKQNEEGEEEEVEEEEFDKIFEEAKTYVQIKITFDKAVIPENPEKPEPQPHEIVPIKQFITWPYSKDPCDDFGKQVTLAVESLAKEFYNMFKKQVHDMQSNQNMTEQETSVKFDEMKKEFFYEINTQGKYHILKEKMKKSIVRIVKEHFKRTDNSIRGLTKDPRDHFYSELYNFLVEQMRKTVRQLVHRKKNELHANIIIPKE